jgi:hypothetical protein
MTNFIQEDSNEINKQSPCWDGYVQRGMKPGQDGGPVPNCVPATKSDGFMDEREAPEGYHYMPDGSLMADEEHEKEKSMFENFGKDFTRATRLTDVFKADSVRVGQMVSWNSSGGRATGKVKRVIRSGSYKVPGTDVTINASEESPAVVITLYRNGEATDTTVAHRMGTLRAL